MADDPTTGPMNENGDNDRTTEMTSDDTRELPTSAASGPTAAPTTTGTGTHSTAATETGSASAPRDGRPAPRARVGWHDTDVTSLVFGLLFLGIAAVWLLVQQDVVSWPDASRIFPVVLVVAGVIGLVSSLTRSRRSRREEQPYPPA